MIKFQECAYNIHVMIISLIGWNKTYIPMLMSLRWHKIIDHVYTMRDERKKQARSNKQTRQSNTAHPRQSLFLEKMSCLGWDSNPRHSTL